MDNLIDHKQTSDNLVFAAKEELYAGELYLKNYTKDIVTKISKAFSRSCKTSKIKHPSEVLEFGAGIGTLACEYLTQNKIRPECVEIDPEQIQIIKNRGFSCFKKLSEIAKKYDAIYTSNVLEHIENDSATIAELYDCLKPGGHLAVYVPAFMCLWTQMDEAVGHYRRYTKKELCKKISSEKFEIVVCHYVDCVGFFAWLWVKIVGYQSGDAISSGKSFKFFDKFIYPLSQVLDICGFRYLFGKNLLMVAKKPMD